MDPRKTHKKKYWIKKTPMRKRFANTKYPRQKITDQKNTHEKRFWTHEGTGGTMAREPRDPRLNKTDEIQHTPRKVTTSSSITARLLKSTKRNCFEILKTIFSKCIITKLIKTIIKMSLQYLKIPDIYKPVNVLPSASKSIGKYST